MARYLAKYVFAVSNPHKTSAHMFNSADELKTSYWHEAAYDQSQHADFSNTGPGFNRIGTALDALGLNAYPTTQGGLNTGFSIEHFDENDRPDGNDDKDTDSSPVLIEEQDYVVGSHTYTVRNQLHPSPLSTPSPRTH
jgi:hypothetical protein